MLNHSALRFLALFAALAFAACSETATVDDSANRADTGVDVGVEASDSGSSSLDAVGDVDALEADVSEQADAGVDDVGPPDAGTDSGVVDAGDPGDLPIVTSMTVVIDRDIDVAPTPINQAYVAEIDATGAGDRIYSYQKYFRSEAMNVALMNAARRGAEVRGFYGDDVDPTCESLLVAGDTLDCGAMFTKASGAHHKNMMILRGDGTVRGIIGSYNPRLRNVSDPRVHTVLLFEVANGAPLFEFYAAEADRLTGTSNAPRLMTVPVQGGGEISLTFHPGPESPVLDLLNSINSCDGILWLSYFDALPDSVSNPVFDRLQELVNGGCDVRFLLDGATTNSFARLALASRGVPVEEPTLANGDGTLGHKIVSVVSNGEAHLMQGSANLGVVNHMINHNLSVHVRIPSPELTDSIEAELLRYWP